MAAARTALLALVVGVLLSLAITPIAPARGDELSPAQFRRQANAICARSLRAIYELPQANSDEELIRQFSVFSNSVGGAVTQIRRLDPPRQWKPDVARMLAAMTKLAAVVREARQAFLAGDQGGTNAAIQKAYLPVLDTRAIASRLGLVRCTVKL